MRSDNQKFMTKSATDATRRVGLAVALALCAGAANPLNAAEATEAAAADPLGEIVVTGSRILRRDLDADSPVVTVEEQAFERTSTLAVESVLNQLPQFVPANTQFNTADVFPSATTTPGISTVMVEAFNIVQDRIARSRLAGDPPDAMINLRLSDMGLFDFHRADELIRRGEEATKRHLAEMHREIDARRIAPGAHTGVPTLV